MSTFVDNPPLDAAIGRLAQRQHGVVALRQVRALGLSAQAASKRMRRGQLYPVHRGVYAVGHPRLSGHGRWMAAVLACGPDAVLSHRSAAALWGLRAAGRAKVEVTVARHVRPRPGMTVRRSETLRAADITEHDGIRCTTPARTLLDLAEVLNERELERTLEEAEVRRLFDLHELAAVVSAANGRRGRGRLRGALDAGVMPIATASELEERFLGLCRASGLPPAEVNGWLVLEDGAIRPDFLWRAQRLVVELDGHASHGTRQAFERDRLRDRRLTLAGFRVVRFTWRQVTDSPSEVAASLRRLLAR